MTMNHQDTETQRHRDARSRILVCARLCAFVSLCLGGSLPSSPSSIHRLTHEIRGIRSLPGSEFLYAPAVHFSNVEVSFLVHTETMHAPEPTGKVTPHAP